MRALVTGATGFVGSRLTELLVNDGHEVAMVRRESTRPWRIEHLLSRATTIFADLEKALDGHVKAYARGLRFEKARLKLDSIWINVMEKGAVHTPHIHPHSAVSGTYYVTAPPGSGAIRFEDPRLGLMMAAPTRKAGHFVDVAPRPGMLLLWESWLRHGVEVSRVQGTKAKRISISFNYA